MPSNLRATVSAVVFHFIKLRRSNASFTAYFRYIVRMTKYYPRLQREFREYKIYLKRIAQNLATARKHLRIIEIRQAALLKRSKMLLYRLDKILDYQGI
jgi:hypothetical protein